MSLFPSCPIFQYITIALLGPLPCPKAGNVWIVVITYSYYELSRAVSLPHISITMCANAFLFYLGYPYGMLDYVLTDNGRQSMSQFFAGHFATLGTMHVTTTRYLPQTNGQTDRYNRTPIMHLWHYIAANQSYPATNEQRPIRSAHRCSPSRLVIRPLTPAPGHLQSQPPGTSTMSASPAAAVESHWLLSRSWHRLHHVSDRCLLPRACAGRARPLCYGGSRAATRLDQR